MGELMGDRSDDLSDDSIQCLRPTSVAPPVDRNRRLDALNRRLDARNRPDYRHCSSPSRSKSESRNGRSMVRRLCLSMGSNPILHLIGCQGTAQPHPTGDPTGFATPMIGLAPPRFQGRRARPPRLGRLHHCPAGLHHCPAGLHHCPAGRHPAPCFPFRPAWASVPGSGNRRCHAGAENQTVFEGS